MSAAPSQESQPAAWWSAHLAERARHERDRYVHQERRAQILAGVGGALVAAGAGLVLQDAQAWVDAGWLARALAVAGWLLLVGATGLLWVVQTPMLGRGFPPGSVADLAQRWLCPERPWADWIPPEPGTEGHRGGSLSDAVQAVLRGEQQAAALVAESPAARALLARYLRQTFHTDLAWWLEPASDDPDALREIETRVRLVFWLWASTDVARLKGAMVRVAMAWASRAALLLLVAVALSLGGWVLLVGLLLALLIGPGAHLVLRSRR